MESTATADAPAEDSSGAPETQERPPQAAPTQERPTERDPATVAELAADPAIGAELRASLAAGIPIGAAVFYPPDTMTFRRRTEIMKLIRECELVDLIDSFREHPDPIALEAHVTMQAYERGRLFDLYGALLVEKGQTWTPALAKATAARFEALEDPAEHAALDGLVLWLLLDFFLKSAAASPTFLKYLKSSTTTPTTTSRSGRAGVDGQSARALASDRPAAMPISPSGTSAFEPLPGLGVAGL